MSKAGIIKAIPRRRVSKGVLSASKIDGEIVYLTREKDSEERD
jgi:hypothetical protein